MRIERVALEDHRDVPVFGLDIIDELAINVEFSAGDVFQAGDHAERRGFSAAGRTDKNNEFLVLDFDVDVVDGRHTTAVHLLETFHDNF